MIEYYFTENNIKFLNTYNKQVNVKIIGVIKGVNILHDINFNFNLKPWFWFIPNMTYSAYSSMEIHVDDVYQYTLSLPSFLTKNNNFKPKIIGIGLNKTGTTSFKDSMGKCGFKVFNENYGHQYLVQDVHNGNVHSTLSFLESPLYDVYEDLPFSLTGFYETLYKYRPQDYYVLTVRNDVKMWVESAYNFYVKDLKKISTFKDDKYHNIMYSSYKHKISTKNYLTCQMINWGINSTDNLKDKLEYIYKKHLDDVTNFFDKKLDSNFIVIDVSKENELKRLSNHIGFETKEKNFEWSNKRR